MFSGSIFVYAFISVTITGKKLPDVIPVKVTKSSLPTGRTLIEVVVKSGSITAPIYIAAEFKFICGNSPP